MPDVSLIRGLLLPELSFVGSHAIVPARTMVVEVTKDPKEEFCPKCATRSVSGYDRRRVRVKDAQLRGNQVQLVISKRRLWCKPCQRAFTEPIAGIRKGARHTERYGRALLRACELYSDLKQVRRDFRCSAGFLYTALYRHLELERRKRLYPWPDVIGLDEHFFGRNKRLRTRDFVSMVVDFRGKRLMEVVEGRTIRELENTLSYIPGRENVRLVALDMSDVYKGFARRFFPNARLVADKFHVLRLLNPALTRRRKDIVGDRRSAAIRRLLLRNGFALDFWQRLELHRWLDGHPDLR